MRTIRFFIKKLAEFSPLFPALTLASCFLWIHASTHPWNSDHLYIEAWLRDWISGSAPLREFHFSASTFLFPDYLIYLPLRLITENLGIVFFSFMLIQYAGLLLLFRTWVGTEARAQFFFIATLAFFGLLDRHWISILYPVHHGPQWIWGMLFLSRMEPFLYGIGFRLLSSALISAAFMSSDLLFGFTGVGPYVLSALEDAWHRSDRRGIRRILIWSASTLLATLAAYFVFRALSGSYFGWNKPLPGLILDRTGNFLRDFHSLKSSWLMVGALLYLMLNRRRISAAGLILNSSVFSVLAVIATGVWAAPENVRYIQPVGVALSWTVGTWFSSSGSRYFRWGTLALLLLSAGFQYRNEHQRYQQSPLERPYLAAHACLDRFISESGINQGIGDYWSAKWLSFLSREGAKILQVNPALEPHYWINNHEWYRDFHPRFAIMNFSSSGRIRPEELRGLGTPEKIIRCPQFDIWTYPAGAIRLKDPPPPKHPNFQEFKKRDSDVQTR
jgi:hypothetical protein